MDLDNKIKMRDDWKKLLKFRAVQKAQITVVEDYATNFADYNGKYDDVTTKLEKLEEVWSKFVLSAKKMYAFKELPYYFSPDTDFDVYEKKYRFTLGRLQELNMQLAGSADHGVAVSSSRESDLTEISISTYQNSQPSKGSIKSKTNSKNPDVFVLPSPQRVRNILTLEERVRAIQAYDCRPMYTKVAKMFNCSWEQIKNIIANRDAILEFYAATKNTEKPVDPNQDEIRQQKITFLGECMYEYMQRAQFHQKADLTEDFIRMKAFEFRDVIQIENFLPNKPWINHFKTTYNFSLSNRQIIMTRVPPFSLDLKDIMTYCTRNKSKVRAVNQPNVSSGKNLYRTTTKIAISSANDATVEELNQRRQRKISFLEKALHEYVQRSQYHHKLRPSEAPLLKVACELKEMLKIDNFTPKQSWLNSFMSRFDFNLSEDLASITRTPPLSLDLKDILSYCSRHESKNQTKIKVLNLGVSPVDSHKPLKDIKAEIIEVDDEEERDIKPNIAELISPVDDCQPPPLKIQKIESMRDNYKCDAPLSPGHWSEHSDKDDEELPKQVRHYEDALKLLKPLEEFAMLEENYRVIGLISQLEEIFKSQPKKSDDDFNEI